MTSDIELQSGITNRTEADAVAEIASSYFEPVLLEPGSIYSVRGPEGHELVDLQGSRFTCFSGKSPVRAWGTYRFSEHLSFCEYINRYTLGADKTNLFASREKLLVEAVINDHAGGGEHEIEEDWGDHRAILNLQHTQSWKDWNGINKKPLDQVTFAEFTVRLTISVKPLAAIGGGCNQLVVKDEISTTVPKRPNEPSLWFFDEEEPGLQRDDPRQMALALVEVQRATRPDKLREIDA